MINWVDDLIQEYKIGKEDLAKLQEKLDVSDPQKQKDYEIIGSMISDMQFAIDWMNRGSRPGTRRGAEKQSVYQRTVLLDTDLFPSLQIEPDNEISNDEKRKLVDILWKLSKRERECFILHKAYGRSQIEIAEELNITRRSVRDYIDRAENKIKNILSCRPFVAL